MDEPCTNTMVPLGAVAPPVEGLASFLFHIKSLTDSEPTFLYVQCVWPTTAGAGPAVVWALTSRGVRAPAVKRLEPSAEPRAEWAKKLLRDSVGLVDEVINQIKPQPLTFEFGNYPWLTWGL